VIQKNDVKKPKIGLRGYLRLAFLRVFRNPIVENKVAELDVRCKIVETRAETDSDYAAKRLNALDQEVKRLTKLIIPEPVKVPVLKVATGHEGEVQVLRQKLSAFQTRVDIMSVTLAETRADLAGLLRHQND
jgi:hypothetical protein